MKVEDIKNEISKMGLGTLEYYFTEKANLEASKKERNADLIAKGCFILAGLIWFFGDKEIPFDSRAPFFLALIGAFYLGVNANKTKELEYKYLEKDYAYDDLHQLKTWLESMPSLSRYTWSIYSQKLEIEEMRDNTERLARWRKQQNKK